MLDRGDAAVFERQARTDLRDRVEAVAGGELRELVEFLRIPSISADPEHTGDVRAAADWVCEVLRSSGGSAEVVDWDGVPLAIGALRASGGLDAPTLLCYGHFDVQPPDPVELWTSPPFEPTVRDGFLYARGAVDDKGPLYMLLAAARDLALADALPVNIRFCCDGQEEVGGDAIVEFLAADDGRADAAIIFDGTMIAPDRPVFNIATRGIAYFHLTVRTGTEDLHSGIYGGAALNAAHVLTELLAGLLPREGRLPQSLRSGASQPSEEELAGWRSLPPGDQELGRRGAQPADRRASQEFYMRTFAEPSLDVNGIITGSPLLQKTVIPIEASANVSLRLAPGQRLEELVPAFERLIRASQPAGTDVTIDLLASSPPGIVSPDTAAIRLACEAWERSFGHAPLLIRTGGSLPVVAALAKRGIPAIVTGFGLPDSRIHAPNERLLLDFLDRGIAVAKELFLSLAAL